MIALAAEAQRAKAATAARQSDCVVVGASFAGLACAAALARAGMRVTILERKADVGEKLHTTGILVKDAIDHFQSDLAFNLLGTKPMRAAASLVYFHRKGVFDREPTM